MSLSHDSSVFSGVMRTRTGNVLTNIPMICWTPSTSGGRPDTTAPKTTSRWPQYLLNINDHAPLRRVLSVRRCWRVKAFSAVVVSSERDTRFLSYGGLGFD